MSRRHFCRSWQSRAFTMFVVACGLWAVRPASAQNTGSITGRVTSSTGQALASAQVYLVGTGLGTLTGANGRYNIVNVPAGQYRLRAGP